MDTYNHSTSNTEFKVFPADLDQVKAYTEKHRRHVDGSGHYAFRTLFLFLRFWSTILSAKGTYRLGNLIGLLMYKFKVRRHIAITNMDIAWGDTKSDEEKDRIYKESMKNFGQVIVNWLSLPFKKEDFWKKHVRFTNEEILREAMNRKKGIILLAAHIGMWDLAGGKIGMSGYPIAVVARRIKNAYLDRWAINTRCRMNFGSIRNKQSMDRIMDGLNNGEAIAMAIDQSMQKEQGIFINWMGRAACSVRSAAYVAKKSGAPVLTGYMLQHGPKEYEMIIGEEIPFEHHSDPEEEMRINTQKQSDAIQKIILEHPEKWFWIHKRWKVQPDGTPNAY